MKTEILEKEYLVDFIKFEEEKRLVTGIVCVPDEEDTYGDTISKEEIEKAMVKFMAGNPTIHVEHDPNYTPKVSIIENWIQRGETMLGNLVIKAGSWLMTVKVFDDGVWEMIKSGKLNGFSFQGPGIGVTTE